MPALPSFINYKSGWKTKAAIKAPFYLLRGEPSTSSTTASPLQNSIPTDVIDINDHSPSYSLDFDGGKPIDTYENPIVDEGLPYRPAGTASPQVQLNIDISRGTLTDWFPPDFLQSEEPNGVAKGPKPSGSNLRNGAANLSASTGSLGLEEGMRGMKGGSTVGDDYENEDEESSPTSSSEDVLANLRAMDPSHFGKLPGYEGFNRLERPSSSPKKQTPNTISIPSNTQGSQLTRLINTSLLSPISPIDTPLSSAISGTTIARALLSNGFILPNDNRSSRYRSGAVGLTRSDSATLPRSEHSFGAAFNDDRFSTGSDAPPVPSNASSIYEPPKKPRTRVAEIREKRKQNLRRRSSTGSLAVRVLPDTPESTRPSSLLLSPGAEFDDIESPIPRFPEPPKHPPLPRSPLPPTPKPAFLSEDDKSSKQESGPDQEVTQAFPIEPQPLSPEFDTSPTTSPGGPQSGKNLDDVLNYYTLPDSPELPPINENYRPPFSPISEESSSQLSPPTPYRGGEKRESRTMPIGARNPVFPGPRARGESVPLPRRPAEGRYSRQPLHPVGERPISTSQLSSPSSPRSSSSFTSVASDLFAPLAPPQLSSFVNRQRSGSAPIPIRVVRDSSDANAYKIVMPSRGGSNTPSAEGDMGDSDMLLPDFPETANIFSPMFTEGASRSPSVFHQQWEGANGVDMSPMPTVPMSATLPRTPSNLAQQALLNRTGSTVMHSKPMSISPIQTNGLGRRSRSGSNARLTEIPNAGLAATTANVEGSMLDSSTDSTIQNDPLPELLVTPITHTNISPEAVSFESSDQLSAGGSINSGIMAVDLNRSPSRGTTKTQSSDGSSMYTSSSGKVVKSLPAIPVSPSVSLSSTLISPTSPSATIGVAPQDHPLTTPTPTPAPPPTILTTTNATPHVPPPPPLIPPSSPTPLQNARTPVRTRLPPELTITSSAFTETVAVDGSHNGENLPLSRGEASTSTSPPAAAGDLNGNANGNGNAPNQTSVLTYKDDTFTGRASDIFRGTSLGSPPPYYTVVNEAIAQTENNATNHTHMPNPITQQAIEAAALASFQFSGHSTGNPIPRPPSRPGPLERSHSSEVRAPGLLSRESSTMSQRMRMRPPLPAGPRRPSQASTIISGPGLLPLHYQRDREGSISSVNSNNLHHLQTLGRDREPAPIFSPKFQTPTPRWRGYTMEAAKWTFTSEQLQAVVSRAIRQSAEASSIRLLRLEVLDNEIPQEMRMLEAQRTDMKTRYKVLTKRRATVVDALSSYMTQPDEGSPAYAWRLVEDLKEIAVMLDRLAEELHSVNGQLAQLDSMTHIHMGSALAMALRKLNASFLKQVAENQVLRNKIQALEAERDEAWAQAECVANECDRMSDKEKVDGPSSNRSSRISAVRKSSLRASKAGLRSSSVSSLGSSGLFATTPSKSPLLRLDKIPPVPPIPKRKPLDLFIDSPLRRSMVLSPPEVTPTSANVALAKAQDELYALLGIANPERSLRRSLSASVLKSPPLPGSGQRSRQSNLMPPMSRTPDDAPLSGRRSSLPANSHLAEVYNAMQADRNAVLATMDMLSSE